MPETDFEDFEVEDSRALVLREEKPEVPAVNRYLGASTKPFTPEQKKILEQKIDDSDIDILPTGEIYASQVRYRRILNDAFGPGGWAILPMGDFFQAGNTLCREYALWAEGRFVSSAIGEAEFQPNNPRFSKATAAESLKSNALTRCCKDLLIASDCWDKHYAERWIKENAVEVWCEGVAKGSEAFGKKKKLWRRKTAKPFEYPWREGRLPAQQPEDESQENPQADRPPVMDPHARFKELMAEQAKRIGRAAYFRCLGQAGYENAQQIADKNDRGLQKMILEELAKIEAAS